ncbi:hypothetical protein U2060_14935, partial [Listeria monocytogenes]|uniref:hypothetical protein n=1 Tax=Listeria monocytogenes TaxID=1639 RepID=UPI002FDC5036
KLNIVKVAVFKFTNIYSKKKKEKMKTFLTSYFQIMLVALNTIFLMQKDFIMVFIISCLISLLWDFNVAKVSISTLKLKLIYSLGAGCGA